LRRNRVFRHPQAEIEACLKAVGDVRQPETRLHLLGITRTELVESYERYGVVSFDSTSPFRQAFKDDRDNYYAPERKYLAVRVMQIEDELRIGGGRRDDDHQVSLASLGSEG